MAAPPACCGQALGEKERGRPAGEIPQQTGELLLESRVRRDAAVGLLQIEDGRHEGFGDVPAAEGTEMAGGVRQAAVQASSEDACDEFMRISSSLRGPLQRPQ